ncbi:MAG TPA: hypothetical protein VNT99_13485 [Methylomirabilota bacterium]|nr:hypothetical protein [Methylomirabilota bacterium]
MTLRTLLFVTAILTSPPTLFAMSGSRPVAWPGQPVPSDRGWPAGAVELINDPARTEGWNPWFSGWPNDVHYYVFKLSDSVDANRLIQRLAAIRTNVHLKLNPAREAGALAFTTRMKPGNSHAAVFSLGNQRVLDELFAQRSRARSVPGNSASQPAARPAAALPPTFTLYVGHPSIDLSKLGIPDHVNVSADIPEAARNGEPAHVIFQAINALVAKHKIKQKSPADLPK